MWMYLVRAGLAKPPIFFVQTVIVRWHRHALHRTWRNAWVCIRCYCSMLIYHRIDHVKHLIRIVCCVYLFLFLVGSTRKTFANNIGIGRTASRVASRRINAGVNAQSQQRSEERENSQYFSPSVSEDDDDADWATDKKKKKGSASKSNGTKKNGKSSGSNSNGNGSSRSNTD